MPTTFANTINGNEILAKRAERDYAGNDLQTTYATKSEVTTGLALKEDSANKAQTLDPSSSTDFPSSAATADYVNSSVATATANFLGNFTLAELGLTYPATDAQIGAALDAHTWPAGVTPTNNDYTYIEIENPQTTGIDDSVERFKFNGTNWVYEYTLNNSTFTAAEKAAIDSGIDSAKVAVYDAHIADTDIHVTLSDKSTWNAKQDAISDLATIRSGAQAGATAVQPGDLATVAVTGAYSDLTGTPTIPTATSDLTNDSGFITLSDVPAQVNADWNSSSGASEILNKPTIPSGSDLVPPYTLPTDEGKVLTVGPSTTYWATPAAGGVTDVEVDGTSVVSGGVASITMPTVDQTYNSASTDAQSGTAVAGAIATKEDAFDVGTGLEMNTSGSTPTLRVEAPVDIVAGPGIVIDNPDGNTLRVSMAQDYEVTLWSGSCLRQSSAAVSLSESASNFEKIEIYALPNPSHGFENPQVFTYPGSNTAGAYLCPFMTTGLKGKFSCGLWTITNGTSFNLVAAGQTDNYPTLSWDNSYGGVVKVVGVHRISGGN